MKTKQIVLIYMIQDTDNQKYDSKSWGSFIQDEKTPMHCNVSKKKPQNLQVLGLSGTNSGYAVSSHIPIRSHRKAPDLHNAVNAIIESAGNTVSTLVCAWKTNTIYRWGLRYEAKYITYHQFIIKVTQFALEKRVELVQLSCPDGNRYDDSERVAVILM